MTYNTYISHRLPLITLIQISITFNTYFMLLQTDLLLSEQPPPISAVFSHRMANVQQMCSKCASWFIPWPGSDHGCQPASHFG